VGAILNIRQNLLIFGLNHNQKQILIFRMTISYLAIAYIPLGVFCYDCFHKVVVHTVLLLLC